MLNDQQTTILKYDINQTISLIQSMDKRDYVENEVLLAIYDYVSLILEDDGLDNE